jgi:hypothetical protein
VLGVKLEETAKRIRQRIAESPDLRRAGCERLLVNAGMQQKMAARYAQSAATRLDFYNIERAARLLHGMAEPLKFDDRDLRKTSDAAKIFYLEAGDVIYVPEAVF